MGARGQLFRGPRLNASSSNARAFHDLPFGTELKPVLLPVNQPRSAPLRSRAMGLHLEEACQFEW